MPSSESNPFNAVLPLISPSLFVASLQSSLSFSLIAGNCILSNGNLSKYFWGTTNGECGRITPTAKKKGFVLSLVLKVRVFGSRR